MSDTPETDGEWNRLACQDHPEFERNLAEFASRLERQRNELLEALEKLTDIAERNTDDGDEWHKAIANARTAIAKAKGDQP